MTDPLRQRQAPRLTNAGKPDRRAHPDQAPTCGLCDQPGTSVLGGVDVCDRHHAVALDIGVRAGTVGRDGSFTDDGGEQRRRPVVRMQKRNLRGAS